MKISNDYGIGADVAVALEAIKLDIGGKFTDFTERRVRTGIEFWPKDA